LAWTASALAAGGLSWSAAPTSAAPTAVAASVGPTTGGWTVYHGDPLGTGTWTGLTAVNTSAPVWTSPQLDGEIYGQPHYAGGDVLVATENNTVYSLSAQTGSIVWSKHLATPVPNSDLPCGNISPVVGVTGTPVIDGSRRELFVVAEELTEDSVHHVLVGLDIGTGRVEVTVGVDPPGAEPAALLQRTGLNLDAGSVVFGMGGNYGDCAAYQGRVVSVAETGGSAAGYFTVAAGTGQDQGAVWMGGAAPAVDASGHVWVAVGNSSAHSSADRYDYSDSALELSSSLSLLSYFAPRDWAQDNAADRDMSTVPAVLNDGQVVVAGKSRIAYLLSGGGLGGIGGQEAELAVPCGDDIDGGVAVSGTTVYLPCLTGPVAVAARMRRLWSELAWPARSTGGCGRPSACGMTPHRPAKTPDGG